MVLPATPGWVSLLVVVCGSPPLLAGARRLWWCVSRVGVSFVVCVCGVCGCARWPCCVVCRVFVVSALLVVWCGGAVVVSSACAGVCGWVCVVCRWSAVWCSAPCLSWPLAVGVVPRHSWLGSTGCVGGGPGCPSPWSWCVCVRCVALRVGVGGVGGSRARCGCRACACVCLRCVVGGVCHTLVGSRGRSSAQFKKQKKRSCRRVAEMRGMRDA